MKKYNRRSYAGSLNPNWRGGVQPCLGCNKPFSTNEYPKRGTIYCQSCYAKTLKGKTHPNWKGGLSKTKEYRAHYDRIKRDKRRGAIGTHTLVQWEALKMKYGYMCLCCKQTEPKISLTRDHIVPLTKGGTNDISNIQPLCKSCNSRKYTSILDYRAKVGHIGEYIY